MPWHEVSVMVKLYLVEESSAVMTEHLFEAEAVATCRIAWVEAQAAFSRRARENQKDAEIIDHAKAAFAADWGHFLIWDINQKLVERAGEYTDIFALRGYDSVHLAAAFETAQNSQAPTLFACFDNRLNKAARTLGLSCL